MLNSRIVREVRLLFLPWCLMTCAGLVPALKPFLGDKSSDWPQGIAVFGFFGGAAFLTALSFSRPESSGQDAAPAGEIEHRENAWAEKMSVLAGGVVLAGLIACLV